MRSTLLRLVLAVLAGGAALVALFPYHGDDSDPPVWYSVFDYPVPTGSPWLAVATGIAAGVTVWLVFGRVPRRRSPTGRASLR